MEWDEIDAVNGTEATTMSIYDHVMASAQCTHTDLEVFCIRVCSNRTASGIRRLKYPSSIGTSFEARARLGSASSAIDGHCNKSSRRTIAQHLHDALMLIARRSWCGRHSTSFTRRCYSASSMEKRDYAVSQM